jgi:hypothetical protein
MKINFQRSIKGVFYDRPFNLDQKYKKPNSFLGKMVIILISRARRYNKINFKVLKETKSYYLIDLYFDSLRQEKTALFFPFKLGLSRKKSCTDCLNQRKTIRVGHHLLKPF